MPLCTTFLHCCFDTSRTHGRTTKSELNLKVCPVRTPNALTSECFVLMQTKRVFFSLFDKNPREEARERVCFPEPSVFSQREWQNLFTLGVIPFVQPSPLCIRFFLSGTRWLWTDHNETIPSKYHLAADHMRYERDSEFHLPLAWVLLLRVNTSTLFGGIARPFTSAFDEVMVGTPLYVTSLRRPLDHLRSMFNYFALAQALGEDSFPC